VSAADVGAGGAGDDGVATGGAGTGGGGAAIPGHARPALGRGFRFQWEPAQKAHVLLYPEGMVKLNGSAGEIMKRCDGVRTVADIVADLERTFATTGLEKDVHGFLTMALEKRWLEMRA
jgi:pyrroloquinoline quinone biosynthesis protein D